MIATVTYTVEVAPGETVVNPSEVTLRSAAYEDGLELCCEPQTGNSIWNHIGRALGTEITLRDEMEEVTGEWTVVDDPSLTSGSWIQVDPSGTVYNGQTANPEDDATAAAS